MDNILSDARSFVGEISFLCGARERMPTRTKRMRRRMPKNHRSRMRTRLTSREPQRPRRARLLRRKRRLLRVQRRPAVVDGQRRAMTSHRLQQRQRLPQVGGSRRASARRATVMIHQSLRSGSKLQKCPMGSSTRNSKRTS